MTNFAPVNPDSATGKAAELLAQVQKSLGGWCFSRGGDPLIGAA